RIVVVVPHMRGEGGAVEHLTGVQDKQLEQGELLRAERDRPAAATHRPGAQVYLQVRDAVARRREGGAAARQGLEAGEQLTEGERLGQIVVGTDFQPPHAVVDGVERRQHQDRRRHAVAAQLAAQPWPLTVAERTSYASTSNTAEVGAFLDSLQIAGAPIAVSQMGTSALGRPIYFVIAADPPVASAPEAAVAGKLVVYVQANIHAGEVEGKEAVLALL